MTRFALCLLLLFAALNLSIVVSSRSSLGTLLILRGGKSSKKSSIESNRSKDALTKSGKKKKKSTKRDDDDEKAIKQSTKKSKKSKKKKKKKAKEQLRSEDEDGYGMDMGEDVAPDSYLDMGVKGASDLMNSAFKLTKSTMKGAVDLAANKHVTLHQIVGKWRLSQEIEIRKGVFISTPATFELTEDNTVITNCDGERYESEFILEERPWPRKCTIKFSAKAFKGPKDVEPVSFFYKGYFKRSIMNPKIVLMRGKVYRLKGKAFWKSTKKIGTFKAQKRHYG
jgi:hypothetical protein